MLKLEKLSPSNINKITSWFEDPDTQKYLGKIDWIEDALSRMQESIGKEFRGAIVLNRVGYIAYDNEGPVGYIEAEIYDKYSVCSGLDKNGNGIVEHAEDKISAGIVYVVNPQKRHKGYSSKIIKLLIDLPELSDVEIFRAGTESENKYSILSLQKVGFKPENIGPDFEGMLNWIYRK